MYSGLEITNQKIHGSVIFSKNMQIFVKLVFFLTKIFVVNYFQRTRHLHVKSYFDCFVLLQGYAIHKYLGQVQCWSFWPFKLCHGQLTLLIIVMLFSLWKEYNDHKYNHIIKMLLKNPCLLNVVHFGKVKGCLFSKTSLPWNILLIFI